VSKQLPAMLGRVGPRAAVIAVLYIAAGAYAEAVQPFPEVGSGFWPASGVAVAGLLTAPRRWWPAILAAIVAAQAGVDLLRGGGPAPVALWATGNLVGHLACALLVERWHAGALKQAVEVVRFVVAALVGSLAGAAIGAVGVVLSGVEVPYLATVGKWALGDGLGTVTVAPLGVLAGRGELHLGVRRLEGLLVLVATGLAVLVPSVVANLRVAALVNTVVLVPMLWAAVRLRVTGAVATVFLVTNVTVVVTWFGGGPFAPVGLTPVQASALMQGFLLVLAVTVLLLGSRTVETEHYQELADERATLLATVSHELRTPLTPIIGYAQLLRRRELGLDDEARSALEVIHRNGVQLSALIDDLVRASEAQRHDPNPSPRRLDLGEEVRDLVAQLGGGVEVVRADAPATVDVDPLHLQQILANLVTNALRHGEAPVEVAVVKVRDRVEVRVDDHGEGVPDEFVDVIFDEFTQVGSPGAGSRRGLGLGLSISRRLAQANGGDLVHRRREAGGARFVLTLPRATAASTHTHGGRGRFASRSPR
jgi:signal transduction histidine kinase